MTALVQALRKAAIAAYFNGAVRSGLARVVLLLVAVSLGLLTTRLIVYEAGASTYGYVALVASVAALLPFTDFGTGAAVTNAVSGSKDPSADANVQRTMQTAVRVLVISSTALSVTAIAMLATDSWPAVLGGPEAQPKDLPMAATVALLAFSLSLPLALAQRILLGVGRNHLTILAQGVAPPVSLLLVVMLARSEAQHGWFAVASSVSMLVASIVTAWAASKATGISLLGYVWRAPLRRRHPGAPICHLAGPMLLITVGLPIGLQSDRLIVSHMAGAEELALYSIAAQVYAPFWAVISSGGATLWPEFAKRRSEGEPAGALLQRSTLVVGLVGVLAAVILVSVGPWVGAFLSGGTVEFDRGIFLAFAGLLFVQGLHLPAGMALTDAWGLRFQAGTVTMMIVVNVPLSLLLADRYGASGPVVASVVAVFATQLVPTSMAARRRLGNGAIDMPREKQ